MMGRKKNRELRTYHVAIEATLHGTVEIESELSAEDLSDAIEEDSSIILTAIDSQFLAGASIADWDALSAPQEV